jgi:hypothetical protein
MPIASESGLRPPNKTQLQSATGISSLIARNIGRRAGAAFGAGTKQDGLGKVAIG